ncbi:hypothetical protein F3J44_08715 [Pantoea sp. Tr-811]|nr:hypothetical protein [Pantoea sp. Tr-811]
MGGQKWPPTDADSVAITAIEASIVKIISSPPSSLLPPTDSSLAGTNPSRVGAQDLDALAEETVQISRIGDLQGSDATADVDLEKVAALRQSIADGSLQTDAQAIYTSLVADIREMAGSEPT